MTIYLDCNATTPIDPEVMEVVRHYMEVDFGNAGSRTHEYGLRAKQAVERAREQVAAVVDAKPDEVIFTSGATEANNLAILGLEEEGRRTGRMHIVSTEIEHRSVLEPLREMQRRGFRVTLLPPTRSGWVPSELLSQAITHETLLVSIMHVNNDTGIIQPVTEYCKVLEGHDAFFHVDASQGFSKVSGLEQKRVDLISASGHKIHAPKGVGALIVRRRGWNRVPLRPVIFGGGQERGYRSGTAPVHLITGMGTACSIATRDKEARRDHCGALYSSIIEAAGRLGAILVGDHSRRVHTCVPLIVPELDSEAVMLACKGRVAISNGSACTSHEYRSSHVLTSMGYTQEASGYLRVSWCHLTPADSAVALEAAIAEAVRANRDGRSGSRRPELAERARGVRDGGSS